MDRTDAPMVAVTDPPTRQDALELLREDHRLIAGLFDSYAESQETLAVAEKSALVARICNALTVHAAIEEEIFFPAIRETVDAAGALIDIAEVEHASIKRLSDDLSATTPSLDSLYDAKVAVLGRYFSDHVHQQEDQLFPRIRKTAVELTALGEQLALRRSKAIAQLDGHGSQS